MSAISSAAFSPAGRIVVGVDGSKQSQAAVAWAMRRAKQDQVGVTLVLTLPPLQVPPRGSVFNVMRHNLDFVADVEAAGAQRLARVLDQTAVEWPGIDLTGQVLADTEPAVALVEASRTAHLTVVGTRGLGMVRATALGSVSTHLVAHAQGPVVVVPDQTREPSGRPVAVGVDDADHSRDTLRTAITEARTTSGRLLALHAWEYSQTVAEGMPNLGTEAFAPTLRHVQASLDDLVAAEVGDDSDLAVESRVVLGRPGPALVDASHEADLVVVGSRGRSGLFGMVLGSTCRDVVRRSVCPVLVVPSPVLTRD